MFDVRELNVGDEAALARDEAAVFAHPPVSRHEAIVIGTHLGSSEGWLEPRMRSAASAIASTIWA